MQNIDKETMLQILKQLQEKNESIPMEAAPLEDMTPEKAAELDGEASRGPASEMKNSYTSVNPNVLTPTLLDEQSVERENMQDMRFQRLKNAIKGEDNEKPLNMQKKFLEEQGKLENAVGKTGVPETVGAPDEASNILINDNESMKKYIDDQKNEFDPFGIGDIVTQKTRNKYSDKINKNTDEINTREILQRLNMIRDLKNQK